MGLCQSLGLGSQGLEVEGFRIFGLRTCREGSST